MGQTELLAALQARVERTAAGEPSALLEPDAFGEARQLAALLGHGGRDLQTKHLLGRLHWHRFQALPDGQNREDLDAAVEMFTVCFLAGTDDLPAPLLPLVAERAAPTATAWLGEISGYADPAPLTVMVELWRRIVAATPTDHPNRGGHLTNLATALQVRFKRSRAQADLDAAIEAGQEAVAATSTDHPNRAAYLFNLMAALRARYDRSWKQADLDAAIEASRQAVMFTPTDHPDRGSHLSELGDGLQARYGRTRTLEDLDAAIEARQEAVAATPTDHPDRARHLSNLASVLRFRFRSTGVLEDLDTAIEVVQEAVAATPADHPSRANHLSNLGIALKARYDRSGAQADLDAAIEAGREAVAATATDHPEEAVHLTNLVGALLARYERTGKRKDWDAAFEAGWKSTAAAGSRDRPDFTVIETNLANVFHALFARTGELEPLEGMLDIYQRAVATTPTDHPDRARYLSNLGYALRIRFERSGEQQEDLDAAIEAIQEAVEATPADHPDRGNYLSNLGYALQVRFEHSGVRADLDAALSLYGQVVEDDLLEPSVRIRTARAAVYPGGLAQPGRVADLLEVAVRLLPEVAPRELERSDQQYAIGGSAGLASDAAALALDNPDATEPERARRALRLLEAGRAVLLSQALDTRSDLSDLGERHPDLAARFVEQRDRLARPFAPVTLVPAQGASSRTPPRWIARCGTGAGRPLTSPRSWTKSALCEGSPPSPSPRLPTNCSPRPTTVRW